jgi:hypothetical protein
MTQSLVLEVPNSSIYILTNRKKIEKRIGPKIIPKNPKILIPIITPKMVIKG